MSDPNIAHKWPLKITVEEGKKYFWCACGLSKTQPFCDGSHKDTDFRPTKYIADASSDVWFCCCKHSDNKPFCDGTHKKL